MSETEGTKGIEIMKKKEKYREGDCENVRVKESPRHEIQTIPQAPH